MDSIEAGTGKPLTHRLAAPLSGPPNDWSTSAQISRYRWSADSEMGRILSHTTALRDSALEEIHNREDEIRAVFADGFTFSEQFTYPLPGSLGPKDWNLRNPGGVVPLYHYDFDCRYAFGHVSINGEIIVEYQLSDSGSHAVPMHAHVVGIMDDLIDFSYYSHGRIIDLEPRTAAIVQIAGGNSRAQRESGSIFYVDVHFFRVFHPGLFPSVELD